MNVLIEQEEIEIKALKTYALQLGVDHLTLTFANTKEVLLLKINDCIKEILNDNNVLETSSFSDLCDYADYIGASYSHCQINDNSCVIKSIAKKVFELQELSILYKLNFKKHRDNLKEMVDLINLETQKSNDLINSYLEEEKNNYNKLRL